MKFYRIDKQDNGREEISLEKAISILEGNDYYKKDTVENALYKGLKLETNFAYYISELYYTKNYTDKQ